MCIFHWLESKCKLCGFYFTLLVHFSQHLFIIKGSCFQNVQGYQGLLYKFSIFLLNVCNSYLCGKKIQMPFIVLSEGHASHAHFTWCTSVVIRRTSKDDNNIMGHFSFNIYFFTNVTFGMCNRPEPFFNQLVITRVSLPETCHVSARPHFLIWDCNEEYVFFFFTEISIRLWNCGKP